MFFNILIQAGFDYNSAITYSSILEKEIDVLSIDRKNENNIIENIRFMLLYFVENQIITMLIRYFDTFAIHSIDFRNGIYKLQNVYSEWQDVIWKQIDYQYDAEMCYKELGIFKVEGVYLGVIKQDEKRVDEYLRDMMHPNPNNYSFVQMLKRSFKIEIDIDLIDKNILYLLEEKISDIYITVRYLMDIGYNGFFIRNLFYRVPHLIAGGLGEVEEYLIDNYGEIYLNKISDDN